MGNDSVPSGSVVYFMQVSSIEEEKRREGLIRFDENYEYEGLVLAGRTPTPLSANCYERIGYLSYHPEPNECYKGIWKRI